MNPKYLRFRNDLENSLASKLKDQRIYVLIDAANLYHSSVKKGMRIDFLQLHRWFAEKCNKDLVIKFYTAYNPENERQIEFLSQLTEVGFEVVKKPIKSFENSIKGNMDIELAVDAMTTIDLFDTLVLVSGDGDFTYLINSLEKNYKKTIVLGVGGFTSYELHLVADSYFFLDRISKMWKTPAQPKAVVTETLTKDQSSKFTLSTDDFEKAYVQNVLKQDYETLTNSTSPITNIETPSLPAKQELKFPMRINEPAPETKVDTKTEAKTELKKETKEQKPFLYLDEEENSATNVDLFTPQSANPYSRTRQVRTQPIPAFDPELAEATKKSFSQNNNQPKRIQINSTRANKLTNPFPNSANYTKADPAQLHKDLADKK
jgi:uncharacterized LabA/DUF88 family protein